MHYSNKNELISIIKILIYVAKTDGHIDRWEFEEIEDAIKKLDFTNPINLDYLLKQKINLSEEAGKIKSDENQHFLIRMVYQIINANGKFDIEQEQAFQEILVAFNYTREKIEQTINIAKKHHQIERLLRLAPIEDPEKRAQEIEKRILGYAITTAILGAFPIPIVSITTEALIFGCQILLITDIADLWGYHHFNGKTLLESMIGGVGMGFARIIISNIVKFIPGFGSLVGASGAFASTWAMGKVTDSYFASDRQMPPEILHNIFKQALHEGENAYQENEHIISQKQKTHKIKIINLTSDFESGLLTPEEYHNNIKELH